MFEPKLQTITEEPTNLFNEILPRLFMGGTSEEQTIDSPQNLHQFQVEREFDCVVTLYAWAAPASWEIEERRFGFPDGILQNWQLPIIHEIADWAHSKWSGGSRVLIRCQAGLNRSGLVTALVLMRGGKSASESICLIRETRSYQALCNEDFVQYLLSLDAKEPNS